MFLGSSSRKKEARMLKAPQGPLPDAVRRQKLYAIQREAYKECHRETKEVFEAAKALQQRMAHFLTEVLPPGVNGYAHLLERCIRINPEHERRLSYWMYLRSDRFGTCTSCGHDIPLEKLDWKHAATTCQRCPPPSSNHNTTLA
jgi:RNA polymerase-binding transcription factor DksA